MSRSCSGHARIRLDFLPLDATDDYLRGIISLLSDGFTAYTARYGDREGTTGFVALPSVADAERLIRALHGSPCGAMRGKALEVGWTADSRSTSIMRPSIPSGPSMKKQTLGACFNPLPHPTPTLSQDTVGIYNLPLEATGSTFEA